MYFDVSSLFTMVLLDCTVDGTLKRIYCNKKKMILPWDSLLVQCWQGNYSTFTENTHAGTREIYETLEKMCK